MQNFSASDLIKKGMSGTPTDQKIGKVVIGTVLVSITLAILYYLLPVLKPIFSNIADIANDMVRIGLYSLIGIIVFLFVKAEWRNIGYINDLIARKVFNGIITYDPFMIQEKQILQAQHDVEKMMDEKAIIDGQYVNLSKKIQGYDDKYRSAQAAQEIVDSQLRKETDPKKMALLKLDSDDCIRKQLACKNYIDSISPIANDMKFMIDFISEGYQVLKRRIASAKEELNINKDIFESAHAGAEALDRMKRAMVGDIQLNSDAEKAQMAVMQNIALTVGQMKVSMEIISEVTRSANLEEGGKLASARKSLEALNLVKGQSLPIPTATSSFNNQLQLADMQFDFNKLPD